MSFFFFLALFLFYKYLKGQISLSSPRETESFPRRWCLVSKRTDRLAIMESQGNRRKMNRPKRENQLLAFTGAAAVLALAVNLAVSAVRAHRRNRRRKGTAPLGKSFDSCVSPFVPALVQLFMWWIFVFVPCSILLLHLCLFES